MTNAKHDGKFWIVVRSVSIYHHNVYRFKNWKFPLLDRNVFFFYNHFGILKRTRQRRPVLIGITINKKRKLKRERERERERDGAEKT